MSKQVRGNIASDQIKAAHRLGDQQIIQMADGTFTTGNVPKYAADGSLTDSGSASGGGGSGSGGLAYVTKVSASSSASLDLALVSTYNNFLLIIEDLILGTTTADLLLRVSTNSGSSYDSGNNYSWAMEAWRRSASAITGTEPDSAVAIYHQFASPTTSNICCAIVLYHPRSSSAGKRIDIQTTTVDSAAGASLIGEDVRGWYNSASAITNVRVVPSAGNIASGTAYLYGFATS